MQNSVILTVWCNCQKNKTKKINRENKEINVQRKPKFSVGLCSIYMKNSFICITRRIDDKVEYCWPL